MVKKYTGASPADLFLQTVRLPWQNKGSKTWPPLLVRQAQDMVIEGIAN